MKKSIIGAALALGMLAFTSNTASANGGWGPGGFTIGASIGLETGGLYFGRISKCDPIHGNSCHWGFAPSYLRLNGGLTFYQTGFQKYSNCDPNGYNGYNGYNIHQNLNYPSYGYGYPAFNHPPVFGNGGGWYGH